jgi:2-polyprenyl-6-methoxyphenol hydroxylase-like FAD-dependent oxidoreductase
LLSLLNRGFCAGKNYWDGLRDTVGNDNGIGTIYTENQTLTVQEVTNMKNHLHPQKLQPGRRTAIVLGGSIAGIWMARALTDHFARVIVVERDELPTHAAHRPGAPQDKQYHILLRRGLQIMEDLFPAARAALLEAGAIQFDQINDVRTKFQGQWLSQYPSGELMLACSRVLLEATLRQQLRRYPQIEMVDGVEVTGLLADEQRRRITGARIRHRRGAERGMEMTLPADFVVDATGRRSRTPQWLASLGYPHPEETVIDAHLGYVSRYYRQPAGRVTQWKMMYILPNPPHGTRSGLIFPQENNTWVVMMAGANNDHPPTDESGFNAFARSVDPLFHEVLQTAEPTSAIYGYRRTENRWRHYEAISPWPDGFAVVGDAFCGFNPVYGQGMTVAAMTAVALGQQLANAGENLRGLAARFQAEVARVTKPVWLITSGADLAYPKTEGTTGKKRLGDRVAYWYTRKVMDAVPHEERVRRVFLDVNHLLRPATDLFMPGVLWPVLRHSLRRDPSQPAEVKAAQRQSYTLSDQSKATEG